MGRHTNPYFDVVDRLRVPSERYKAAHQMSAGGCGARENRGRRLSDEKVEALLWGLSHESPVVVERLQRVARDDPNPRVRGYAQRALLEAGLG